MAASRRTRNTAPSRALLEDLEPRVLFTAAHLLATGAINGGLVTVLDADSGTVIGSFHPFANYTGGVSVALGDVDGDGTPEVITAPTTPGSLPLVKVFSLNGTFLKNFYAYDQSFRGGVDVASADFTEDGHSDIVTGAGAGGTAHVRVFNSDTGIIVRSFLAFPAAFHGGVNIAVGDVNDDGVPDVICTPKLGGGPVVRVVNGANGVQQISAFLLDSHTFAGGIRVAAGDVNGDGHADIIAATGIGVPSRVIVLSGLDSSTLLSFSPFNTTTGISITSYDADADSKDDIVVGLGRSIGRSISVFKGTNHVVLSNFNQAGVPFQGFNLATFTESVT